MRLQDIDIFYNQYKNSIGEITRAEKRVLKEAYSYEKWQKVLKDKSVTMRRLFNENVALYDKVIGPIAKNPDSITADQAEKFLFHIDYFLSEGYRDYGVTVPVLDAIIPFYEKTKNTGKLFDALFFKALALMQHNCYDESEEIFNRALELYPYFELCEAPYRKYRIMCAHYFRLLSLVNGRLPEEKKILEYYYSAKHLWCEITPEGFLTRKKTIAIQSVLRSIVAALGFQRLCKKFPLDKQIQTIIEEEFNEQAKIDTAAVSSEVYVAFYAMQMVTKRIRPSEYVDKLHIKYNYVLENGGIKNNTEYVDFITLFDDERPDEQFEKNYLLVVNESFSFVHFLLTELIRNVKKNKALKSQIFSLVYNYYAGFTYVTGAGELDLAIWDTLERIIPFCDDRFAILTLLQNICVHRQISTAIHSHMVGKLAEALAEYIYDRNPKFFGKHFSKKEELLSFAKNAGYFHDVGKLTCSDIINLQSRKIFGEEFELVMEHPSRGARLLELNPASACFADVAEGHHRFYDGKGGYPFNLNNSKSKYKPIIDVISICDSFDAATDYLGRNYALAKDLPTVMEELKNGAGTRYNPDIVDMIDRDTELQNIITRLIRKDRDYLQYELYRDYVMPDVKYTQSDEIFVRPMNKDDQVGLLKIYPDEKEAESILAGNSIRYVLSDSKGNVYSYLVAENKKMDLHIALLFTPVSKRRKGYASLLLDDVCEMARTKNARRVYIPKREEGHHDKFGWRRGFVLSRKYKDLMILELRKQPVLFITSSQTIPKTRDDFDGPCTLNSDNKFGELLEKYWPDDARVLAIASDPNNKKMLDLFIENMTVAFDEAGFEIPNHKIDAGDWELLEKDEFFYYQYDVILLAGGHVPTQNLFFEKIKLREKLEGYRGIIIGTSAGSMNLADEVYAMPELEGEAMDKDYKRFIPGLGLTSYQIIPHIDYLETIKIDGLDPIADIAVPDSKNRSFIVLSDGSYIFQADGTSEIHGKHYKIVDGFIRK